MNRRRRTSTIVIVLLFLALFSVYTIWTATGSRADGPPSDIPATPSDDPCFRQDIECYDGVPVQPQLPEEVIGRLIDCPDGSVGRLVDVELHNTCSKDVPAEPLEAQSVGPNFSETDIFALGAAAGGIIGLIFSTLAYLAFRVPRRGN
jgi:hypothetical protein